MEEQKPEDDPECENLIDFMNNLNYDEFIKDMEVIFAIHHIFIIF